MTSVQFLRRTTKTDTRQTLQLTEAGEEFVNKFIFYAVFAYLPLSIGPALIFGLDGGQVIGFALLALGIEAILCLYVVQQDRLDENDNVSNDTTGDTQSN